MQILVLIKNFRIADTLNYNVCKIHVSTTHIKVLANKVHEFIIQPSYVISYLS